MTLVHALLHYQCRIYVARPVQLPGKIQVFIYQFAFFHFYCVLLEQQNPPSKKLFSLLNHTSSGLRAVLCDPLVSQHLRDFIGSYFLGRP